MTEPKIGESLLPVANWCVAHTLNTDTFIDVGANDGILSRYVAVTVKPARLIAIDGNPFYFHLIERNLKDTGIVYNAIEKIVIDKPGELPFYCPQMSPSQSSIFNRFKKNKESVLAPKVKATTLDQIIQELYVNTPIVLKIDAELSEPLVWKGMKRSMPIIRDVCMEFMPSPLKEDAGFDPSAFLDEIENDGFEIFTLLGNKVPKETLLQEPSKIDLWLKNKNYGYI